MYRVFRSIFPLACVAALSLAAEAKALVAIRITTPAERVLSSECIVVGKVTAIEKEEVSASQYPKNTNKVNYQVAVIKVSESLLGGKGVTQIRVGFVPTPKPVNPVPPNLKQPMILPVPIPPRFGVPNLEVGQEGIFFLTKHHSEDFFQITQMSAPLLKTDKAFEAQSTTVTKAIKVLSDPMDALKAKEAKDRMFAASILVRKYRNPANPMGLPTKQEELSAEETKLIMGVIFESDWKQYDPELNTNGMNLFNQAITPQDGFVRPKAQPKQDFYTVMKEAAEKWYKENGEKFRIKKNVVETK
jgi:hypothetical protein